MRTFFPVFISNSDSKEFHSKALKKSEHFMMKRIHTLAQCFCCWFINKFLFCEFSFFTYIFARISIKSIIIKKGTQPIANDERESFHLHILCFYSTSTHFPIGMETKEISYIFTKANRENENE